MSLPLSRVTDFEEHNHMTAEALAIVFSPNLLRAPQNDFVMILSNMGHTHKLVKALITHVSCLRILAIWELNFVSSSMSSLMMRTLKLKFIQRMNMTPQYLKRMRRRRVRTKMIFAHLRQTGKTSSSLVMNISIPPVNTRHGIPTPSR